MRKPEILSPAGDFTCLQAALDAGLEWKSAYVIEADPSDKPLFARLMRGRNARDAFVCRNDPTAARLIETLAELKVKVPQSVHVAGFDDGETARLANPPLTTIHQPVKTLGGIAVASLLQRIRNPSFAPRSILLDAPLVVRGS